MSLRVNLNIASMRSYKSLSQNSSVLEKSVERLSSGLRINRAADDAAGLTISEKLRRQVRGLHRAAMNAQDGISMLQSAEGALNEVHSILHRMRELAVQSSNDTLTSSDRLEIQKEVNQLRDDLNRIATNTEFNTKRLLDGSQTALSSTSSHMIKGVVTGLTQGGDYEMSIALLNAGTSQQQQTNIFILKDSPQTLAQGTTQLQSIASFYDANGVFLLETQQSLTVSGNGKQTQIVLEGFMTLDSLAAQLQNAVTGSDGLEISNSTAESIQTATTGVAQMGGYIRLTSGMIGEQGRISFAGDQKIIDALGLSIIRKAVDNTVEIVATDDSGNAVTVQTDSTRAVGLLSGMDIIFRSQPAQITSERILQEGLFLSGSNSFQVHLDTDWMTIVVASGYWTMEGIAESINKQIDTAINLGLDTLPLSGDEQPGMLGLYASVVDGQIRMNYEKPATAAVTVSTRIEIQNTDTPALGFMDGTYSGFVVSDKNPDKIELGFKKLRTNDVNETTALLVSDGFKSTVVGDYTLLAPLEVTASDMVSFTEFQNKANAALAGGEVMARVDQIDGTMLFTCTRVGMENFNSLPVKQSMISISLTNSPVPPQPPNPQLLELMGLREESKIGTGDTNFKIHIADYTPQYHIGAGQWEAMHITICNMTPVALGVDNLDMTTVESSQRAIERISKALDIVSAERSKLGAYQNRLEYAINNLRNGKVCATASESRIRDADIAWEMIGFTRSQLIAQSATAMLAQSNLASFNVLDLLK